MSEIKFRGIHEAEGKYVMYPDKDKCTQCFNHPDLRANCTQCTNKLLEDKKCGE